MAYLCFITAATSPIVFIVDVPESAVGDGPQITGQKPDMVTGQEAGNITPGESLCVFLANRCFYLSTLSDFTYSLHDTATRSLTILSRDLYCFIQHGHIVMNHGLFRF